MTSKQDSPLDVVIVGSRHHFDPEGKTPETGIGRLLEATYLACSDLGYSRIAYFDTSDTPTRADVRLMVGLESNFLRFHRTFRPNHSFLLSVNQVRSLRATWLTQLGMRWIPLCRSLSVGDNLYSLGFPEFIADGILQLGSHNVHQIQASFGQKFLVSQIKIGGQRPVPNMKSKSDSRPRVLVAFGSIALRKGWLVTEQLIEKLVNSLPDVIFVIQAQIPNRSLEKRLSQLVTRYPSNFLLKTEFMDEGSEAWKSFFGSLDIAIFPSHEEGQQDAVLTCISMGVPTLVSPFSGYQEVLSLGIVPDLSPSKWHAATYDILSLPLSLRREFSRQQQAEVSLLPQTRESVREAIEDLVIRQPLILSRKNSWPLANQVAAFLKHAPANLAAVTSRLLFR